MLINKNYGVLFGALIILCACLAISFDLQENSKLYSLFKPLTTSLIIVFSLCFANRSTQFFKFVIPALIFCLLGDTLLLFKFYFIWGLVAFLVAHVLFILGFVSIDGFKFNVFSLLLLLVFGVFYYWNLYESLGGLKIPVVVYFLVIILMSWQGINLRIWKKSKLTNLLFLAVILFLVSDSILAWSKFKSAFKYSGVLILASYWTSIFLIALATSSEELEDISSKK